MGKIASPLGVLNFPNILPNGIFPALKFSPSRIPTQMEANQRKPNETRQERQPRQPGDTGPGPTCTAGLVFVDLLRVHGRLLVRNRRAGAHAAEVTVDGGAGLPHGLQPLHPRARPHGGEQKGLLPQREQLLVVLFGREPARRPGLALGEPLLHCRHERGVAGAVREVREAGLRLGGVAEGARGGPALLGVPLVGLLELGAAAVGAQALLSGVLRDVSWCVAGSWRSAAPHPTPTVNSGPHPQVAVGYVRLLCTCATPGATLWSPRA